MRWREASRGLEGGAWRGVLSTKASTTVVWREEKGWPASGGGERGGLAVEEGSAPGRGGERGGPAAEEGSALLARRGRRRGAGHGAHG